MISQPVSSIFPSSPLPSGSWQTPGLSIPCCCLPTSSSVCLVFFPRSLCLARWFLPDLMNGRHVHTTSVCVSLPWSGGLRVVRSPAGSWHRFPPWQHGLCLRCALSQHPLLRIRASSHFFRCSTGISPWTCPLRSLYSSSFC